MPDVSVVMPCWRSAATVGETIDSVFAQTARPLEMIAVVTYTHDWEAVGRAHGEVFRDIRPAATMVVVARLLDPRWRVEIEAEAMLDS